MRYTERLRMRSPPKFSTDNITNLNHGGALT